jgi:hypothetical protein
MTELNKNGIKLAQMLELDVKKVEKLFNVIGLSDLAALTTAINNDDMKTVQSIYNKYSNQLTTLPDAKEVQDFYADTQKSGSKDPLADTADHFGIRGEDVEKLMAKTESVVKEVEEPFIPDAYVKAAFENVKEMLKGGKSKKQLTELSAWQRRMFYGLVPPTVAAVCQKTLDMTPIALMQKQAEISGVAEALVGELSLHEMIENIIEHELNNFRKAKKEHNPDAECSTCGDKLDSAGECPTCDFEDVKEGNGDENELSGDCGNCGGVGLEPEQEMKACNQCHGTGKLKSEELLDEDAPKMKPDIKLPTGWVLRIPAQPAANGKWAGTAVYKGNSKSVAKTTPAIMIKDKNTEEELIAELKDKIDAAFGTKDIEAPKAMIDLNKEFALEVVGDHRAIYAKIVQNNGKPFLMISMEPKEGFFQANDRLDHKGGKGQGGQGFAMTRQACERAGLKRARYTLGNEENIQGGIRGYELEFHSAVHPGEKIFMGKPGLTVAPTGTSIGKTAESLIKEITSKKF